MQDETVFYICIYVYNSINVYIYGFKAYIYQKMDCKLHLYDYLCIHILLMYLCVQLHQCICLFKRWIANYIYMTICVCIFYILCIYETLQDEIVFFSHYIYVCLKNTYMTCYETYCFQLPGNGNSFSTRKVLIKLEEKHYMYYTLITTRIEKHRAW